MDVRGRRRRNWITFWLAVTGVAILLYLALPALLGLLFILNGFGI